jgi:hypothetical protein
MSPQAEFRSATPGRLRFDTFGRAVTGLHWKGYKELND